MTLRYPRSDMVSWLKVKVKVTGSISAIFTLIVAA